MLQVENMTELNKKYIIIARVVDSPCEEYYTGQNDNDLPMFSSSPSKFFYTRGMADFMMEQIAKRLVGETREVILKVKII